MKTITKIPGGAQALLNIILKAPRRTRGDCSQNCEAILRLPLGRAQGIVAESPQEAH
jgi:hypothetical protein